MEIKLTRIIELLILPPGFTLVLIGTGLALSRRFRRISFLLISLGIFILYLSSIPLTALTIAGLLEKYPPLSKIKPSKTGPQAIVVLGGGRYYNAPEYGQDTVSWHTLERLRYAAWLHRQTGLPILLSGGTPLGERLSEALLMKKVLADDFNISAQWVEEKSRNTFENALYSYPILKVQSIDHIYLVTHALHMPRALDSFRHIKLKVTTAPTGFSTPSPLDRGLYSLLPRASSLLLTREALHEFLGRIWHTIRYP